MYHQKLSDENFDICIPGEHMNDKGFPRVINRLQSKTKDFLNTRIKELYFFSNKARTKTLTLSNTFSFKKRIRVIFPGTISYKDMQILRTLSHSHFMLTTGDQSISEGLGNNLMVEVPHHKESSFESMVALAKKYNLIKLASFLEMGKCDTDNLNENFKELAALIDDPELQAESIAFKEKVKKTHNLEINLGNYIEKWMEKKNLEKREVL